MNVLDICIECKTPLCKKVPLANVQVKKCKHFLKLKYVSSVYSIALQHI